MPLAPSYGMNPLGAATRQHRQHRPTDAGPYHPPGPPTPRNREGKQVRNPDQACPLGRAGAEWLAGCSVGEGGRCEILRGRQAVDRGLAVFVLCRVEAAGARWGLLHMRQVTWPQSFGHHTAYSTCRYVARPGLAGGFEEAGGSVGGTWGGACDVMTGMMSCMKMAAVKSSHPGPSKSAVACQRRWEFTMRITPARPGVAAGAGGIIKPPSCLLVGGGPRGRGTRVAVVPVLSASAACVCVHKLTLVCIRQTRYIANFHHAARRAAGTLTAEGEKLIGVGLGRHVVLPLDNYRRLRCPSAVATMIRKVSNTTWL